MKTQANAGKMLCIAAERLQAENEAQGSVGIEETSVAGIPAFPTHFMLEGMGRESRTEYCKYFAFVPPTEWIQ